MENCGYEANAHYSSNTSMVSVLYWKSKKKIIMR
jgi:hypothetical protein